MIFMTPPLTLVISSSTASFTFLWTILELSALTMDKDPLWHSIMRAPKRK